MSENQDHFGTRYGTGKLHAAQHVVIYDVASDSADERVAASSVKYLLRWYSRIDTSEDHCYSNCVV